MEGRGCKPGKIRREADANVTAYKAAVSHGAVSRGWPCFRGGTEPTTGQVTARAASEGSQRTSVTFSLLASERVFPRAWTET